MRLDPATLWSSTSSLAEGRRHLVIDVVVTTVYHNTVVQRVASIPGYAAKQADGRKLLADRTSLEPIAVVHGGPYVLAHFAIEDCSHLGAHAHALLTALAIVALEKDR